MNHFLTHQNSSIVIEAKKSDLGSGFRQLLVELIAVDKLLESDEKIVFGAVSIGLSIWLVPNFQIESIILKL